MVPEATVNTEVPTMLEENEAAEEGFFFICSFSTITIISCNIASAATYFCVEIKFKHCFCKEASTGNG